MILNAAPLLKEENSNKFTSMMLIDRKCGDSVRKKCFKILVSGKDLFMLKERIVGIGVIIY